MHYFTYKYIDFTWVFDLFIYLMKSSGNVEQIKFELQTEVNSRCKKCFVLYCINLLNILFRSSKVWWHAYYKSKCLLSRNVIALHDF